MTIGIISDLHVDFYLKHQVSLTEAKLKYFWDKVELDVCDVLVVAGDIGHYNTQNVEVLKYALKTVKDIVLVAGNHELYLVSSSQERKYKSNSFNRLAEFKQMLSEEEHIHFLDGDTVEIDGVTFGGTSMWYDFSYRNVYKGDWWMVWKYYTSDAVLIKPEIDNFKNFFEELYKLKNIIYKADVIVTHVAPYPLDIPKRYQDDTTSMYLFDGEELIKKSKAHTWIYGHQHSRSVQTLHDTLLIRNPLGYPAEARDSYQGMVYLNLDEGIINAKANR